MSELLAKAIDQHALDQECPKDELEPFRQFLAPYATLDEKGRYTPTGSSGYAVEGGGYAQAPVPLPPFRSRNFHRRGRLSCRTVRISGTCSRPCFSRSAEWIGSPTPFTSQVKPSVRLNAPVTAIRRAGDRVRIEHGPGKQMTEADYCVCTLPLPILGRIPSDFSAAKKAAIAGAPPISTASSWRSNRPRFWETDDSIFGGLAWTDRAQRERHLPVARFGAPKRCDRRRLLRRLDSPGHARTPSPPCRHEERIRISREFARGAAPGKVASAAASP